ncbi:hypothetical protein [Crocinitomix catalasitica]|uniref:hypothetical protein n=1 Tax=Crocinitomix catalasitica TaxID=184607 RepID=UPI0004827F9C|nr:hypothetical protein [Crocinitomix catalasitica]
MHKSSKYYSESKAASKELLQEKDVYHAIYYALSNLETIAETIIKSNVHEENFDLEIAPFRYAIDSNRHALSEVVEQAIKDYQFYNS